MFRGKYILSLLGVLLSLTACQKIDENVIENLTQTTVTDNTSNGGDDSSDNDNSGNGAETNPDSQEPTILPDSTQLIKTSNHVIALVKSEDDKSSNVLLISLNEWHNIAYSTDADIPTQASYIASKYQEGDLKGWRIPSSDEAKALRNLYKRAVSTTGTVVFTDTLAGINKKITALSGQPLNAWQAKDNNPAYRYLCEGGTYSFSLKAGSTTSAVGKTVSYNLRLVRDSIITK